MIECCTLLSDMQSLQVTLSLKVCVCLQRQLIAAEGSPAGIACAINLPLMPAGGSLAPGKHVQVTVSAVFTKVQVWGATELHSTKVALRCMPRGARTCLDASAASDICAMYLARTFDCDAHRSHFRKQNSRGSRSGSCTSRTYMHCHPTKSNNKPPRWGYRAFT